jgi:hypothetical protein
MWSEKDEHGDHNKIHKCMTIMSQIGNGKSNIVQVTKLQNMAYRIAKDYGVICQRLE